GMVSPGGSGACGVAGSPAGPSTWRLPRVAALPPGAGPRFPARRGVAALTGPGGRRDNSRCGCDLPPGPRRMRMRGRFPTTLALLAAVPFVLQPSLCDALHAGEDGVAGEFAPPAHGHADDPSHLHPGDGAASAADPSAEVEDPDHCCAGHDRPPVVLTPKQAPP